MDDATSAVVNAVFCISENTAGYFTLLEGLIERWGIPLALYSDRHAVFKHNARKAGDCGGRHSVHPWPAGTGGYGRFSPARHRPRVEWSAWQKPSRTGW